MASGRWTSAIVLFVLVGNGSAAEGDAFFTQQIKPILVQQCQSCHSHLAKKDKGGLMLDSRAAALKGGDTGPAVVPNDPAKSLLLQAVEYANDDLKMPPKGKLPAEQVALLRKWIEMGAPWPDEGGKTVARPKGKITDEDRQWWAFQPVKATAPPAAGHPIDAFIHAKLGELPPAPQADRRTLIRRVYYDLVGLPPMPDAVEAFVRDTDPNAYSKLVDQLLASPQFGEKWARHWLDLVRYAESDGYRIDDYRPAAWRYRDYVIRSFNADKPYDCFLREQLAGDELFPDDVEAKTATGFLAHGIYEYNNRDVRTQWDNMMYDVVDTTADVFLGLGMGCARCHDHKFDPILQKDYFRLKAFFGGLTIDEDATLATAAAQAEYARKLAEWEKETTAIRAKIDALELPVKAKAERDAINKFPDDLQAILRKPVNERTTLEQQLGALAYRQVTYEFGRLDRKFKDEQKHQLVQLRKELAAFDARKPAPLPRGWAGRDVGTQAAVTTIPKKGNDPIAPGFLTLLDEAPATITPFPGSTGRRAALAQWLTRPDHPLTARVWVNRLWHQHFGKGLVATTSDFGKLGEKPSHPELLDYLATRLVQEGWSSKAIHKLIVTSATYQQSSAPPTLAKGQQIDPENRRLWRANIRRLEAEQIRDSLLAVTGKLDPAAGGPSVEASVPRRTVYTKVQRNTRDPLLEVFDVPDGFQSMAERNVTTTPTQSLLMMNSPFMLAQSKAFAERLRQEQPTPAKQIERAFHLAFGRAPTTLEQTATTQFLAKQTQRINPVSTPTTTFQYGKLPFRDGRAALMTPGGAITALQVASNEHLPTDEFTIEAFVLLRSTYDDATVRPIAGHWSNDNKQPGWALGITSKKSAYKPQMLVLQLADGTGQAEPIFSGLHIDLHKPYFVAATVKVGDTGKTGITFYSKDLSNDDEPIQLAHAAHKATKLPAQRGAFWIGGSLKSRVWDGLIDDVRLSNVALPAEQLLLTRDGVNANTVGYWQFEAKPGSFRDSAPHGLHLAPTGSTGTPRAGPEAQALADLAQVLLNANEFLYVD